MRWGDKYNLLDPNKQKLIRGWITANLVVAVWLGTPCNSFSTARDNPPGPPPLRSDKYVYGLPNLSQSDQVRVDIGNILAIFSASILLLCCRFYIPVCMENPFPSRIWKLRIFQDIFRMKHFRQIAVDFCQFGKLWKNRTRIISFFCDLSKANILCSGIKGICSRTGKPHVFLCGKCGNRFLISIAEPYPKGLCQILASAIDDAIMISKSLEFSRQGCQ